MRKMAHSPHPRSPQCAKRFLSFRWPYPCWRLCRRTRNTSCRLRRCRPIVDAPRAPVAVALARPQPGRDGRYAGAAEHCRSRAAGAEAGRPASSIRAPIRRARFSFGTGSEVPRHRHAQGDCGDGPAQRRCASPNMAWSPDQRHLAFTHVAYSDKEGGLGGGTVAGRCEHAAGARRLTAQPLSYMTGTRFQLAAGFQRRCWCSSSRPRWARAPQRPVCRAVRACRTASKQPSATRQLRTYPGPAQERGRREAVRALRHQSSWRRST